MNCELLLERLEELSPKGYAEKWDNVGLLVGRMDKEVNTIYIALDATDDVINAAAMCEADLLITHHPMIFSALKTVTADDFIGRRVLKLAKHDISYYAMHTNFDVMGMADAAADELGLLDREVLSVTYEDEIGTEGFGRIGTLEDSMSLLELCEFVKERFDLEAVKVFGDLDSVIDVCAIAPGSGKSMIKDAIAKGAQVIVTGDIDHHDGIDALAQGLAIIDAGHFGIEKLFVPYMEEFLRRELPDIKIYTHELTSPFKVI